MTNCRPIVTLLATVLLALSGSLLAAPVPPGAVGRGKTGEAPLPPGAIGRLGTERLRHGGYVMAVAFLPDGKLLSAGTEGLFRVWDPATGTEVRRFGAPGLFPERVAISPDGKVAASSSGDRKNPIQLWDVATGKARPGPVPAGWPAPPGPIVTSLAFSPDSKILATITRGRVIILWDVATGKAMHQFERSRQVSCSLAFSPDGQWLVAGEINGILSVWKAATGEKIRVMQARPRIFALAFAPNSKTFASSDGNGIALWKTATGESVWRSQGRQQPVRSLGFTPDGRTLVSWDFAGTGRSGTWPAAARFGA